MNPDLAKSLHEHLDSLDAPEGDLVAVRAAGTRIRRRRRAVTLSIVGGTAGIALAAGIFAPGALQDEPDLTGPADRPAVSRVVPPLGPLDFTDGLRAYASPDGSEVHLGGRTFTNEELAALDTDAAATAAGIVYYDNGQPMLLDESGTSRVLEPGADTGGSFAPTAKSDSGDGRAVAYGAVVDGVPTVIVRDLVAGQVMSSREVTSSTTIDALDRNVVALRDTDGTSLWEVGTLKDLSKLAGPETRVADMRAGVILYDGPEPDGPAASDYTLVPGAIDSQLTFDGGHILAWSGTLAPTDEEGSPIVLQMGPKRGGYAFWTIDTDGSVLLAVPSGAKAEVYDCAIPSGACAPLKPVRTVSGDPVFIGNDT